MKNDYLRSGRAKQKAETRSRILEEARTLIRKGKVFSLEDLAKNSGISRATVYRYFSNIEVLMAEAALDIKTLSPEDLSRKVADSDTQGQFLKIQDYFNQLSLTNEEAFRKYLSSVLKQDSSEIYRGARRVKALRSVLERQRPDLDEDTIEKLVITATVLMGIEPVIVARDVCGLSKEKTKTTLRWALEAVLKNTLPTD